MPILPSDRHELFATYLASGMLNVNAYAAAGYKRNMAAASKLANTPNIKKRVEEIKQEKKEQLLEKMGSPENPSYGHVKEFVDAHDIDLDWVVDQYRSIYEKSVEVYQFAPANTAIANIQKIIEARDGTEKSKAPEVPAISVTSMLSLMKGMSDMIGKGQLPPPPKAITVVDDAEIVEAKSPNENNE